MHCSLKGLKGLKVVRLKGGDPSVFGRVGEEAAAVSEHGIPYEMVPGITSGIAAPLYAGLPVTHRDFASSFAVVTAHDKSGKPEMNWEGLAKGVQTLVFYMGIKTLVIYASS
ncbi:SAM-dependent methyltransferase [Bacillus licheniformis]|nr:SAM-dependent methyltransferase [Bacillus licheniformis]